MRERWSNTSIALHWLAVAFIVGLAAAGFVMTDLPADSSGRLLISRMHTLGGTTLMLLTTWAAWCSSTSARVGCSSGWCRFLTVSRAATSER